MYLGDSFFRTVSFKQIESVGLQESGQSVVWSEFSLIMLDQQFPQCDLIFVLSYIRICIHVQ